MKKPKYFHQFLVIIGQNVICLTGGMTIGWSSPIVPLLSNPDTCPLSSCDANLIPIVVSVALISAMIGPYIIGPFLNVIGRKPCIIIGSAINLISWLMVPFASTMTTLIIARILNGAGYGMSWVTWLVYAGEIASLDIRGAVLTSGQLATGIGVLVVYILGAYLSFSGVGIVISIICAIHLAITPFIPESPSYLIMKGRIEEAEDNLKWLRQSEDYSEIQEETKLIQISLEHTQKSTFTELFTSKVNWKPFLTLMTLKVFEGFNGGTVITVFATSIFTSVDNSLRSEIQTIILGSFAIIPTLVVPFIIEKVGRRKVILTSCIFFALFMTGLATYFYLERNGSLNTESYKYTPLILLVLVQQASGMVTPVIAALNSELLQDKVRGLGTTIVQTFHVFMFFMATIGFGYMMDVVQDYYIFWFFAANSACLTVFSYYLLPETKGKNSEEIRKYFE